MVFCSFLTEFRTGGGLCLAIFFAVVILLGEGVDFSARKLFGNFRAKIRASGRIFCG